MLDDGYLAIAGTATSRNGQGTLLPGNMFVALLEPLSGLADPGFGDRGIRIIEFGDIQPTNASGEPQVIQQSDGKLVVAGFAAIPGGVGDGIVPVAARMTRGDIEPAGFLGSHERNVGVNEADGEVVVTVFRAGGGSGAVTMDYETFAGTATSMDDFAHASGTLTWGDGDMMPKSISVTIVDDGVDEPAETFDLRFSGTALQLANETVTVAIAATVVPPPVPPPATPPPATPAPAAGGGGGAMDFLILLLLAASRGAGGRWRRLRSVTR